VQKLRDIYEQSEGDSLTPSKTTKSCQNPVFFSQDAVDVKMLCSLVNWCTPLATSIAA